MTSIPSKSRAARAATNRFAGVAVASMWPACLVGPGRTSVGLPYSALRYGEGAFGRRRHASSTPTLQPYAPAGEGAGNTKEPAGFFPPAPGGSSFRRSPALVAAGEGRSVLVRPTDCLRSDLDLASGVDVGGARCVAGLDGLAACGARAHLHGAAGVVEDGSGPILGRNPLVPG